MFSINRHKRRQARMEEWVVFEERKQAPARGPNILIQSRGAIVVSERAGELLLATIPNPKKRQEVHVELLQQKNRNVFGIRVAPRSTTTYPLRPQKRGTAKAFLISCKKFLRALGVELRPQRFAAHMQGSVLVV